MISYEDAVNDFLYGNGSGEPSEEVCMKLIKDSEFTNKIVKAIKEGKKSISFCSNNDGTMIIVYNPLYISSYSTCIVYCFSDKEINVWFDRN